MKFDWKKKSTEQIFKLSLTREREMTSWFVCHSSDLCGWFLVFAWNSNSEIKWI